MDSVPSVGLSKEKTLSWEERVHIIKLVNILPHRTLVSKAGSLFKRSTTRCVLKFCLNIIFDMKMLSKQFS